MIFATSDKDQTLVLGDPKANLRAGRSSAEAGAQEAKAPPPAPLTEEEISDFSRIKCSVCGQAVDPDDVAKHSRECVLDAAPNLKLQLDKWCIASSHMTSSDLRAYLQMRRTEELSRVEGLEEQLARQMTPLWWMGGRFGFVVSAAWLREWRGFVGVGRQVAGTRDRPPGPINNNDLFGLDGTLRPGLREGIQQDYHVLEQPIWEVYYQIYGGGPTVIRYNSSGVLPALSDQPVTFEGDWRDRRPETGCGTMFDPYSGNGFDGEIRSGFLWEKSGKGLLRNGSHYEGEVSHGLPDGQGREVRPDGVVLEGGFRNGKLHGFGRCHDAQGHVLEGEWEDGELMGI